MGGPSVTHAPPMPTPPVVTRPPMPRLGGVGPHGASPMKTGEKDVKSPQILGGFTLEVRSFQVLPVPWSSLVFDVTLASSKQTVALSNLAVLVISKNLPLMLKPCGTLGDLDEAVMDTSPAVWTEPKVTVAGLASPGAVS